jgi:DNA mismatch repair protein MutS2
MEADFIQHETRQRFSLDVLEYGAVLNLLRTFLSSALSAPLLDELAPNTDLGRLQQQHALTAEARECLREGSRPSLGGIRDPRPMLEELSVEGGALPALEIVALLKLARAARDLRPMFARTPFTRLHVLLEGLADFRGLVGELDGKILPDGPLADSASPALARIRRSIERLRVDIQGTLERLLRRLGQAGVLQDTTISLRNDRFVLPVRAEDKYRVDGIVHGSSSSGATLYVEPMETVVLNNELVEFQDREFAEVQRILGEFTEKLRLRRDDLARATAILSELDLIFARAVFAREYDCCLPEFVSPGQPRELILADVRHPLLDHTLRRQNRKSVPLTVELREPKTLVIISGPNTGGKTVTLKTVGIAVLMAQSGLPVDAGFARLPLFDCVLADIGDQQSIAANLSTFSAHIRNIESMARAAGPDTLVLLDELGSSTDPSEGAALGVATLEHFRQRGAITFVSTHHGRLKAYAAETREAINAAMEFDEATLEPTYRLLVGLPGKSSGIDIAQRLGLEPSIVAHARTLIDPAEAEAAALIASLHQQKDDIKREIAKLEDQRRELEVRKKELERKFEQERRTKLKELDDRLAGTLREHEDRWEKTVAEIRAQIEAQNRAAPAGAKLRAPKGWERKGATLAREAKDEWNAQVLETLGAPAAAESVSPVTAVPAAVGDRVRVNNLSTPGLVTAVNDDTVEVEVGRMRMRVRPKEVQVLTRASGPVAAVERPIPRAAPVVSASEPTYESPAEINVIGRTADEARDEVDQFLDQAFLAGRPRLRVIHGFGKGILRRTLHEMFASHPHVEKYYAAPPQEGGAGATIVELRV